MSRVKGNVEGDMCFIKENPSNANVVLTLVSSAKLYVYFSFSQN